jgi:hypothetical protein
MTIQHGYDYWLSALDGGPVDWPRNFAMPGFFRKNERDGSKVGIAIWLSDAGRPVVKVGKAPPKVLATPAQEAEFCEYSFAWCSKYPVSEDAYRAWFSTGKWFDDVPEAVLSNAAGAPHEVIAETIADIKRQAEEWLAGIGGAVTTQQQADTAANYADRFGELAKEADKARITEKEPILKAQRDCDGRWKPVEAAGKDAKKWASGLTEAFLKAERARKLAEAAKAAEAGQAVRDEDVKVKAGTRGRSVTLRKHKELRFPDMPALRAYLAADDGFWDYPDVLNAIGHIVRKRLEAGIAVPGAAMVDVETSA